MGWFNDKFAAEPIECPRGWGTVSFVLKFLIVPPIILLDRRCPISGLEHCTGCRHPMNPGLTEHLRVQLVELDELRGSTLSEAEFRIRRRLIVEARDPPSDTPGQRAAIAAFVLGPLGVVAMGAGWYLSSAVHLGFLGLLGGGLVLSALAAGLTGASLFQRRSIGRTDDSLVDELREDTHLLEARLGRAQEELGFFRELHEPASRVQPVPSSSVEPAESSSVEPEESSAAEPAESSPGLPSESSSVD